MLLNSVNLTLQEQKVIFTFETVISTTGQQAGKFSKILWKPFVKLIWNPKLSIMKANGIRTMIIRGVLLILLSLYFLIVFGQKSPNLISFTASRQSETISLQWLLASSNNLSTVIIEKKLADSSFQQIAEFWVNFEGNKECNFRFSDKKVKAKNTQYRLKLVTDKGNIEYSDIVSSSEKLSGTGVQQLTLAIGVGKTNSESDLPGFKQTEREKNLKSLLLLRLQEREINFL
ncbi:MAG: hypothetical protein JSS70_05125 [Bacteroidetes bacterium]|nr:hypothetical protein [Bacteroidota bacterium]